MREAFFDRDRGRGSTLNGPDVTAFTSKTLNAQQYQESIVDKDREVGDFHLLRHGEPKCLIDYEFDDDVDPEGRRESL